MSRRRGRPNKPKKTDREVPRTDAITAPSPDERGVDARPEPEDTSEKVVSLITKKGFEINGKSYASVAESLMDQYMRTYDGKHAQDRLTTTKLRGIYALVTNVYVRLNTPEDYQGVEGDIQYLKVRMAYEAGREDSVKEFLATTHLKDLVDSIDGFDEFGLYCRYAEALVAYFKFFGGKDK